MILGSCPFCDHSISFAVPDHTPVFSHQTCEACGKAFWEYHSRFDPKAYTEEAFCERFEFDEESGTIKDKPIEPLDPIAQKVMDDAMQKHVEDCLAQLWGASTREAHET